jgi:uncharacterized membrane protein SpoIIM required for sporulation
MTAPKGRAQGTANEQGGAEQLIAARRYDWGALDALLTRGPLRKLGAEQVSQLARLYRGVCADLVRAEALGSSPTTLAHLDALASRAHSALYASSGQAWRRLGVVLRRDFPRAVRQNVGAVFLASALFWVPFFATLARALVSEEFTAEVVPLEVLEQMAEAYQGDPSDGRTPGGNAAMAGFYVYNNVGIAFRCFATGILFGLGSAFFLAYNGAVTGAIFGHVLRTGGGPNILTFVAGHAPLELAAIVISGAAGLQLGRALVVTHGRTRLGSLWAEREPILAQILGAAAMLLLAALIEAFWSPSRAPAQLKWAMGGVLLLLVLLHLTLAGRRGDGARRAGP